MTVSDTSHALGRELAGAASELDRRAEVALAEAESRLFAGGGQALPPRLADRYRLIERMGRGGQGEVWRARDETLDREVAIKRMRMHPGLSVAMISDARAEAQALGKLSHPNVVGVFDVGLEEPGTGETSTPADGVAYIVMELVEGASLDRWLAANSVGVRALLDLARQVAQGLHAAHSIGLVHRDIKPANILVGDDGRARVADFGLAVEDAAHRTSLDDAPSERSEDGLLGAPGTGAYMAPEQLDGGVVDARSDQFALAVTIFEALYGKRPHLGSTVALLLDAKHQGPPPQPVPARLRPLAYGALARGMAPDPADRFDDVTQLVR
ncbi:MAG: serine/threonine protein kinase, partial [Deltaproteobacteria bacterium]|nr:serine/threonine protein kinase [Deltaproteobacteria bacterium]